MRHLGARRMLLAGPLGMGRQESVVWQDVTPPAGWNRTLPFTIQNQGRQFRPDPGWSIDQNRPTGKAYYVATNGSDAASGLDAANPLASIKTALNKVDIVVCYVQGGVYGNLNSWWDVLLQKDVSVISYDGRAKIGAHRMGLVWALDTAGGNPNTYKTTYGTTTRVFDAKSLTAYGDYSKLTPQASAAAVQANPGSWYCDGVSTWMRLSDSRVPDADVRVYGNTTATNRYKGAGAGGVLYCENIDFEGYFWIYAGATGPYPVGYFNNCSFKYSSGSGFNNDGAAVYLWNCTASSNGDDGFSHSPVTGAVASVVEYNCIGRDNGIVGDNDNGSTIHGGSNIVRMMGEYGRTVGQPIHDIGTGSQSWNLGVYAHHSLATVDPFQNQSFSAGAGDGVDTTVMWLDCCQTEGSTVDLAAYVGSTIYYHNLISAGVNRANGTYTPY
jgi:hypothetical protein